MDENFDEVFQNGYFFQNDLSISGGSERSTFFFSLGRLDQEGIIKNSDYSRTNVRLNNQTFFTDWSNVSSRAAYTVYEILPKLLKNVTYQDLPNSSLLMTLVGFAALTLTW